MNFAELVGSQVAVITNVVHDWDTSYGYTDDGVGYDFHTNFNHRQLQTYLRAFTTLGLGVAQVAMGELAEGFNEDEGYHYRVPECYALYLRDLSQADYDALHALLRADA